MEKQIEVQTLVEKNDELSEQITDLRVRSMKYNLIFSGIQEGERENSEQVLQDFLANELDIQQYIDFANVHRFGRQHRGKPRPLIAKFLYQRDLDMVLRNARKLRGKSYYINRQFPDEIEQARRSLYPIMKEFRSKGDHVKLVRDTLYVNGEPYEPEVTQSSPSTSERRYTPSSQRNKRRRIAYTPEQR
ncbi:hypothetical protein FSP39_004866 [Pinctada imbricata]|uniref:Uncharacterized protein n=1 Tax=Pinctada imbricata TaxID=66713 RepID=A0AA88XQC3_PINIB|nr:hypothetical protein FSP39_004866 [Pinctada imbricata]